MPSRKAPSPRGLCFASHLAAWALRYGLDPRTAPDILPDPQASTQSGRRRLPTPASTQRAQLKPRLACPLYVSISIHLKDYSRMAAPRTSIGAGPSWRGERRSFRILQNLSLSVTPIWWLESFRAKRGQNRNFEHGFICFEG